MSEVATELNIYDANIMSLADIKDLSSMTHLRSINLHRNHISRIECLDFLQQLVVLDLSSNNISKISGGGPLFSRSADLLITKGNFLA